MLSAWARLRIEGAREILLGVARVEGNKGLHGREYLLALAEKEAVWRLLNVHVVLATVALDHAESREAAVAGADHKRAWVPTGQAGLCVAQAPRSAGAASVVRQGMEREGEADQKRMGKGRRGEEGPAGGTTLTSASARDMCMQSHAGALTDMGRLKLRPPPAAGGGDISYWRHSRGGIGNGKMGRCVSASARKIQITGRVAAMKCPERRQGCGTGQEHTYAPAPRHLSHGIDHIVRQGGARCGKRDG